MSSKSDHTSSIKSTDSKKKKKLSNAKLINGVINTAFTLEEKLQSKGYSNLKNLENSEDAKSSDEDANTSTINSTISSPKIDSESVRFTNEEINEDCASGRRQPPAEKLIENKDSDICFLDNSTSVNVASKDSGHKNSDIRAAVHNLNQNLSCSLHSILTNSTSKCNKSTPDNHNLHQNGFHSCINSNNSNGFVDSLDEHNVEMPTTDQVQAPSPILSALKGILLAFLSSIFFSLTTVIVKYVKEIDAGQMAIYRFAGMLLFVFPIVSDLRKENIFGPSNLRHWIILRGLAGASSLYLRYSTLHYLPISNATVIVLSMPVFVCIFGRIFLKEACGFFHVVALGVTLIGIAFTSKLDVILGKNDDSDPNKAIDRQHEIYGLVSGLGATLVGSSAYIIVRKVKQLHYSVILFNFAWVALLESFVITYTIHDGIKIPQDHVTPWLLMALGILSFYGQMLLTRALQAEEAALVSVTRSASEVFFAFLFQIVIFQQMPTVQSLIGASLVTSAVMLTSVRKYVIDLPEEHLARRIFWFTLK